jgi:ssDNA thymidine ADP-ribosyltransferase, DarT
MGKVSKTYIWRMTHYTNLAYILQHGLRCSNAGGQDPNYINIGHRTLISGRGQSPIAIPPGGVLNDYIPFYFHYKMPMLYNISKGIVEDYSGTQQEIVYLVSTAEQIALLNIPFVFTDRHAYLQHKTVYNELTDLANLNWNIIKDETWFQGYTALRKEVKQAEFLVYQHLPVNALLGLVCHNDQIANFVRIEIGHANLNLQVIVKPEYYYP